MSLNVPINSARRTISFASTDLVVATGIKTSFASVASPVTLTPADFNGANMQGGSTGFLIGPTGSPCPRTVTIARSNNSGQFSTGPIVITGVRGGAVVTESWSPANANGNDVFRGTQMFDQITSIAKPADGGTGGTYTIGVQDIGTQHNDRFTGVELAAAGQLNVQYDTGITDSIPIAAAGAGFVKTIAPKRILTNPTLSVPTTVGLTVYCP